MIFNVISDLISKDEEVIDINRLKELGRHLLSDLETTTPVENFTVRFPTEQSRNTTEARRAFADDFSNKYQDLIPLYTKSFRS